LATASGNPRGCLFVQSALVCGDGAKTIRNDLISARRDAGEKAVRLRLKRARRQKEICRAIPTRPILPAFVVTVIQGIAVQAASGAARNELGRVIEKRIATLAAMRMSQVTFNEASSASHASQIPECRMMPSPRRAHTCVETWCGDRLNGLGFGIPGGGHIGRAIGERFAGLVGKLLVAFAPTLRMASCQPSSQLMRASPSTTIQVPWLEPIDFFGLAVSFQRDVEIEIHCPRPTSHLPKKWFRLGRDALAVVSNSMARDVRGGNVLLASTLEKQSSPES